MKGFVAAAFFVLASSLPGSNALAQQETPDENGLVPVYGRPTGPTNGTFPPLVLPTVTVATSRGGSGLLHIPREDRVLKKGLLAPSKGDRAALVSFLQTRNTGLIRLLPREIYDNPTHRKGELAIRGGGAYYWFTRLTHAYGYGSDIELQRNHLSVGFAGTDYGMLTNLGEVSLENISREDPRARFISSYKPPRSEPQARAERKRFVHPRGVTLDGVVYAHKLPVQENATYLLRSIIHDRSDVLVAFKVVRKDTDGSVIIAWKLLKEYSPPALIRN